MAHYRWELIRCGRPTCLCVHAPTHGPYLHTYTSNGEKKSHLYGGKGGAFDEGVNPPREEGTVKEYGPLDAPHGSREEVPEMTDSLAMAMRREAEEKAQRSERRFRRSLTREERTRFDELVRKRTEDGNAMKQLVRRERGLFAGAGHPIPRGTRGSALANLKREIASQLDAERRELLKQLEAERKSLSESLRANRAEMSEMISAKSKKAAPAGKKTKT